MIQTVPQLDASALDWRAGWEPPYLGTYSEWCRDNMVLHTGAKFDPEEAPFCIDTLNDADPRRCVFWNTLVKPVQAGGSVVGEGAILCWIFFLQRVLHRIGDIQYNWETNEKARARWKKRFQKILENTKKILALLPRDDTKYQTCLIILERLNFFMQGTDVDDNLASDSVVAQCNEEIHNWDAGKLALAYGRTTYFQTAWFHHLNISNASNINDQLHKALLNGTNRQWTVKCPGCGLHHAMQFQWEAHEPHFGGLRWDSDGCRRADGSYDYNRIAPTIRNQMPCGYPLHRLADREADVRIRRVLSQTGKYSEPRNPGASVHNESRTFEAVSVHYIDPIILIQEWHDALKSLRYGDPEPLNKFRRERQCRFVDPEDRPMVRILTTEKDVKKDRAGLAGRQLRLFQLDRQRGELSRGEIPHWWLSIWDFGVIEGKPTVQLVFEGKIETDDGVIETLTRHDCIMHHGVADSGHDTLHVYSFCLKHGINCIKGSGEAFFAHENGTKRIFSKEQPLHAMLGAPAKYAAVKARTATGVEMMPDPREPRFWLYSKHGIRERHHFLSTSPEWRTIIPGDVSKDYRAHMESEIPDKKTKPDGSVEIIWRQIRERNDQFVNRCYFAMQLDRAGKVGAAVIQAPLKADEKHNVTRA